MSLTYSQSRVGSIWTQADHDRLVEHLKRIDEANQTAIRSARAEGMKKARKMIEEFRDTLDGNARAEEAKEMAQWFAAWKTAR